MLHLFWCTLYKIEPYIINHGDKLDIVHPNTFLDSTFNACTNTSLLFLPMHWEKGP